MSLAELVRQQLPAETAYPYETALFQECWWQFLAPKFDITHREQELLVLRKKFLKGLVSFNEVRVTGWNSAWSQDLTATRVQELKSVRKAWDVFRIIWSEDRKDTQRFDLLEESGYSLLHLKHSPQYIADLSEGYEGYLNSLSHNGRTNLRKKVRKAQSLNPHLAPVNEESEIAPFFEELFRYHIPYWSQKTGYSYFSDQEERDFIVEWAKALRRHGQIKMDRLVVDNEVANLSVRLIFGRDAYFLLTVNTEAQQECVPGIVGFAMRIEELANEGIQRYNLGAGDFFYKVQSANKIENCWETIVFNPRSLKGTAYRAWLNRQHTPVETESHPT